MSSTTRLGNLTLCCRSVTCARERYHLFYRIREGWAFMVMAAAIVRDGKAIVVMRWTVTLRLIHLIDPHCRRPRGDFYLVFNLHLSLSGSSSPAIKLGRLRIPPTYDAELIRVINECWKTKYYENSSQTTKLTSGSETSKPLTMTILQLWFQSESRKNIAGELTHEVSNFARL